MLLMYFKMHIILVLHVSLMANLINFNNPIYLSINVFYLFIMINLSFHHKLDSFLIMDPLLHMMCL